MFGLPAQSTAVLLKFNRQLQRSIWRGLFTNWKKNVDYLYCLGEQLIGQNPNQRGDAEIPYVFQNDTISREHFPVLIIKRMENKNAHELGVKSQVSMLVMKTSCWITNTILYWAPLNQVLIATSSKPFSVVHYII